VVGKGDGAAGSCSSKDHYRAAILSRMISTNLDVVGSIFADVGGTARRLARERR
jgi:hypothetical protein